ncbi:glycosyltransferase [Gramella sp. BOM4]|nr:glycosyltransferase [Christiangramia bathymodioli]
MKNILYIGNKLEKHGYSPTSADILPDLLEKEGFRVKAVSSIKNKPGRLAHMLSSILSANRASDLVVIDTYSTANFWYAVSCGLVCKKRGIPYIFILHGGKLIERFNRSSERILGIFKSAKATVAPSAYLFDKLAGSFENLILIPNWLDLTQYTFKKRTEIEPNLLWVRSFNSIYNPKMAIRVVQSLLKNFSKANLFMVGPDKDGSLSEMEKLVREKDLPVKFFGKLSKRDWLKLSEQSYIFLNTTNIDNTPVSVIEAMALGLPVVSTNVGGIPYLLEHEENGLLVQPGNADEMCMAVECLLKEPGLAERLSENARKKVEKFDWEQVKGQWLELLN